MNDYKNTPKSSATPDSPPSKEHLDELCRDVAAGRKAAKTLKDFVAGSPVSEVEFRLLWHLQKNSTTDQRALALSLGVSPAQVSSCVEQLRSELLVVGVRDSKDRRRQKWRLSMGGVSLLASLTTPGVRVWKEAA
ncbi:MarR family transcriptional regulator [Adhaeretor mobilis]|uniref:MarR family protein n=1 Tax=Adhaeretor mobilis TaxID=1930276 RepID=A0A517MZP3_9BACT|nr:helix-turn-helix domain-containing protein [Adhaeretor mobilis]QDT00351.1 MarR family protein [Adhaeretor mobilis]